MTSAIKQHPLFGFLPRNVKAKQVQRVIVRCVFALPHIVFLTSLQEGNENPFTRLPHSPQYLKILEARKKLPVFAQMEEFYETVSPALPFVCEGAIEPAPQVAPGFKAMCR
jgi:pre-mRNA-splicing factor ATP-dependent RNA helicase DHX15/PRP43